MARSVLPWTALAFGIGILVGAALFGSRSAPDPGLSDEVDRLRCELADHRASHHPQVEAAPGREEISSLLEAARSATRQNAESVTEDLVRASDGVVTGEVADAILHLLREGSGTPRCFVMRGVADGGGRTLDPRIVDRCMEIALNVPLSSYDSHYFIAFLVPLVDPKPDELVEFVLERALERGIANHEYLDTLRAGLSDDQTRRCAAAVMDQTERAADERLRSSLLRSLLWLARPEHSARLEKLAANEALEEHTRVLAKQAAKNARERD